MATFNFTESDDVNFTLTSTHYRHLDPNSYIILNQTTTVTNFMNAEFSGVSFWAVDQSNAQSILNNNGTAFSGFRLNPTGQYGLGHTVLPAGQWWIVASYDGTLQSGQAVRGFDEVSVVSLPGAQELGNIPLGVSGPAGTWRAAGFTVIGSPTLFIETEGSGGKYMIMPEAEFQAFRTANINGYTGGTFWFLSNVGLATELEGEIHLNPGSYELVWINDTGTWAGGAGNITAFSASGGSTAIAGSTLSSTPGATVSTTTITPVTGTGGAANTITLTFPNGSVVTTGNGTPGSTGANDNIVANAATGQTIWFGGGGNDTITGSAVADQLLGEDGNDRITGALGNDQLSGGVGDDNVDGGGGNDTINGNPGNDTITDPSGSNYLRGDEDNDRITGGSEFDDINGNMGNDTCGGGLGADWVVGGKDDDRLNGDDGDDIVYGNLGNDSCSGDVGNDLIRGGQGNDTLSGGTGNDWISGDRDNDTMSGGTGADIFHSFAGSGIDRVLDFNRAEGDRVQIDVGSTWTLSQVGADTVITFGGEGGQMILVGVSLASLTGDWIFTL